MNKKCEQCGVGFEIDEFDEDFYKKVDVPEPNFCPDCRVQRRFMFRNERNLYKSKSALSGKDIISCVHPDEGLKVLSPEEWWGDEWNPMDFGLDFDFARSFSDQFAELQKQVPIVSLHSVHNENSPYVNYVGNCKNCYMIFGPVYSEDCFYGSPYYSRNCLDSLLVRDSELCYECVKCQKCYHCLFCQDCTNSNDLIYCYDCSGCSDLIGCVGLKNKKFYIFNESYLEEEYRRILKTFDLGNAHELKVLQDKFSKMKLKIPHKFGNFVNTENCTGDNIYESKNTKNSYDVQRCLDCRYLAQTIDMKDCYDCNYTEENELCYEYMGLYQNSRCSFSIVCYATSDVKYSMYCMSSNNLFGCIGLRHKKYCILNKQYTEEKYKMLVPKIIEHMKRTGEFGKFFDPKLSPFCYNESVASEYFPLSKEEVLAKGFRWRESDPKEYLKQTYQISTKIGEVEDFILDEVLACEKCGKNYKLIEPELNFYRKMSVCVPLKCPDCRHKNRMLLRNTRKLFDRKCDKCGVMMKTTYLPEYVGKVYCEDCYFKEIY